MREEPPGSDGLLESGTENMLSAPLLVLGPVTAKSTSIIVREGTVLQFHATVSHYALDLVFNSTSLRKTQGSQWDAAVSATAVSDF